MNLLIENANEQTGETINRGTALHLIAVSKMSINGNWYRGTANGELIATKPVTTALRVKKLWNGIKEMHNVDTGKVVHDPFGQYAQMLKKVDPLAWEHLFGTDKTRQRICTTLRQQ